MAAPAAPNEFSGHLEKWVMKKCRSSVFFVMLAPKEGQRKNIEARMADVKVVPEEKIKVEVAKNRCGTGFVVDGEDSLKIMTSAHLIDHVFTAKKLISVEEANRFFTVRVMCDHAEVEYAEAKRKAARAYSLATITDIDCAKDILLVEISHADVYKSVSAAGKMRMCDKMHPPIPLSLNPPVPEALDKCVMISWPAEKHLTAVKGCVCHCSRTIHVMPGNNPNGYSMKLLQADIRSEKGASGSALLNGQAEAIGMLHGGDVQFSYFVSLDDLSQFLNRNGVARRM